MRSVLAMALCCACSAAAADQCDARVAGVVRTTGASFDRRVEDNGSVFLRHPLARSLTLQCGSNGGPPESVYLSAGVAYPKEVFFALVADVAQAALNLPPAAVRTAAIQCHQRALAASDETAEIHGKTVSVECQAFRRSGGNTTITVSRSPAR